ncbi:MAG: hypothetical protein WCG93_13650 [Paludibacter sp.]
MNVVLDISNKRWFTTEEACIYTTFGDDKLLEARDLHLLPFRKYGPKKVIYEKKDLDALMEKLEFHIDGKIKAGKFNSQKKKIS